MHLTDILAHFLIYCSEGKRLKRAMVMLVIRLCLLLLSFRVSFASSTKSSVKFTCAGTKAKEADDLRKCVAKDLLLGWLLVINKTSVRLDEVRKNATVMAEGAKKLRKEGSAALANATEVLSELNKNSEEALKVRKIINDINDTIAWANEMERNLSEASNVTQEVERLTADGYGAVSITVGNFVGHSQSTVLKYDVLRPKVDKMEVENASGCVGVRNFSGTLFEYAEKLNDFKMNLTAWKAGMLEKIRIAYNTTQNNTTTCLAVFTNSPDKVEQVMSAVRSALDRLVVSVKKVDAFLLQREKAQKNITTANGSMKAMTTSMFDSLKQNGAALCDMLRRHEVLREKVQKMKEKSANASRNVGESMKKAGILRESVTATGARVQTAVDNIKALPQFAGFFSLNELPNSGNVTLAMEGMKKAGDALEHAVQRSGNANFSISKVDVDLANEDKELEEINNNLKKRLEEIDIGIDITTSDGCNSKLFNKVDTSTQEFLRLAAKLNVSELRKANKTLRELEARAEEINKNVSSVSKDLEVAVQNLKNVNELMRNSSVAAEYVVADVLSHLMSELCATAAELRVTRKNLTLLSANATSIKKSVSEEEAQAIAASKNASGSPDTSPYVEEGFTVAVRMTALLEKELQRTNARLEMMTASRAAAKLKEVHAGNTNAFDAVSDAVVGIFADTPGKPHENVCTRNATSELVKRLKGKSGDFPLLRDTSVITELNRFATKMSDELKGTTKRMNKVAVRAAEANEALAEAVRRAREDAAGRRCLPLHQQLFSALSGWW
ncbi:hypothetical protein, conserved in T. vivax [Trypanosoma vivax Y486]|uniref:Uncharacterized protein n=1 Tax=Trypanosoma vivax (strain Y486) TaxID=1055687 RepID=F9WKF7_TRYVY|nr:hypothetical protein, conserved in T. vivax [Trypanosoma vivax Y486]|eukprot:CCD17977.1 hypothetical protein, conserved in T. vivax [Trypanosoma vivax Y486]